MIYKFAEVFLRITEESPKITRLKTDYSRPISGGCHEFRAVKSSFQLTTRNELAETLCDRPEQFCKSLFLMYLKTA